MTTALDLNVPRSACDIKKVRAVEFGIFSPERLSKMSVCEVTTVDLYENGFPKVGGLNDTRMGTTDYRIPCRSCNMSCKDCPGHFGHIQLARPMYHIGYLRIVLSVLRCVCYGCSRLLADADDRRLKAAMRTKAPKARFAKVLKLCKDRKRCESNSAEGDDVGGSSGCGCIQPKYTKDGIFITVQFPLASNKMNDGDAIDSSSVGDSKRTLSAEEALVVLNRMSIRDIQTLGFDPQRNPPAWMILTVFPVAPPAVRPYVQFGSDRSEDDLTLKLLDIAKANQQLRRYEDSGAAGHILEQVVAVLQYHLATMVNNDIPGLPVATTRSKKPIKSLRQRLKGKEGRLRGNLMGKRVDFSARTVITGDPNLYIDQVGVPKSVAMNLTFPEMVTSRNLKQMKALVANGPFEWPGARFVLRADGTRFDLRHSQGSPASQQLDIGDRVERHMQDDDYVLFNRQPSLHKMSIMGHRTKILPWSTFRLNLSVTSPYNADFDGDEMNLHLAQSQETRAEIKHLMIVQNQIVSSQGNRPVMGIVQDSLLGMAKFTKRDTFLTRDEAMNLLLWIPYWDGVLPVPAIIRPVALWTGKQIVTKLLSFDPAEGSNQVQINLTRDSGIRCKNDLEWCPENDGRVIIRNNEHLAGIICKRTAGPAAGGLIHVLWLESGCEKAKQFLSISQRVINNWLEHYGFTVGCGDIVAPEATVAKVAETLEQSSAKVQTLILAAQRGKLETQPGKSLLQSFEARVNQVLNQARETAGKIAAEALTEENNIIAMVNAGSKGSTINISQIMACVGQQNVEGKRIPFGFKDRSLPHYVKHDYGPESRGFVANSYLTGLTPQELFFHAMGGREGIIDTACKTSETGYIQRRLIKAMEDVLVGYDRTVRNSNGDIVQFVYGEDGVAGEYVEDTYMTLLRMDHKRMENTFKHDFGNHDYGLKWIPDESIRNYIRSSLEEQNVLDNEWHQLVAAKKRLAEEIFTDGESKQHLPINVGRLIEFAQSRFPNENRDAVNPVTVARQLEDILASLVVVNVTGENDYIAQEVQRNATGLLHIHLRECLASRKLLEKDKLGPQGLQWLFGEIVHQFHRSLAHAGEVIGAMAAQSIGEPATQMTLNTFHFAGVGSKNVTLGVPRLKELINVTKTVKTPSLSVYLLPEISHDQEAAKLVQAHLEHTTLEKVTSYAQIVYDPNPVDTIIESDKQWVAEYYEFPDDEESPSKLGPWVLRIQLIEKLITDKGLTMKEIGSKICAEFSGDELDCIWTDDNSEDLVIRIRIKNQDSGNQNEKNGAEEDDEGVASTQHENRVLQRLMGLYLSNITLRGIHGIAKVYMREEKSQVYDPITGTFAAAAKWVLDTDGCNLPAVLAVPEVDSTKTSSNDITEVLAVLGIEAVRRALLKELRAVISFDGSYVNYRHLSTLCDVMTQKGQLMAITRNGINRVDKGCLSKCSFEETVEVLMTAAAFGEIDNLKGVTENVMFGQIAQFGTGLCDLVIDEDKLSETQATFEPGQMQDMLILSPSDLYRGGDATMVTPDSGAELGSAHNMLPDFGATPFSPSSPITSPVGAALHGIDSPSIHHNPLAFTGSFSPQPGGGCGSPYAVVTSPIASPLSPSGVLSPYAANRLSPSYAASPGYSPTSPAYSVTSPGNAGGYSPPSSPLAPNQYMISSPQYSPTSPVILSPAEENVAWSPSSPHYNRIMSPTYSPRSPAFSPASPRSNAMSPGAYSPTSPRYSPTSPTYSPGEDTVGGMEAPISPEMCSPSSPRYDPQAVRFYAGPSSPTYSPTSPAYSPT